MYDYNFGLGKNPKQNPQNTENGGQILEIYIWHNVYSTYDFSRIQ